MKTFRGVDVYTNAFLISSLVGSVWSASSPGRFIPRESPRYPLDRRLGGRAPEPVWTCRNENSCLHRNSNFDPLVIQAVACHYNDCSITAHVIPGDGQSKIQVIPGWWEPLHGSWTLRKASTYKTQYRHRKETADIHPIPECDSNPRSQCLRKRRHFVP
jgi:hypothetical protein